jgi:hypothetical protein
VGVRFTTAASVLCGALVLTALGVVGVKLGTTSPPRAGRRPPPGCRSCWRCSS